MLLMGYCVLALLAGCGENTEKSDGGIFSGTGDVYCIVVWFSIFVKERNLMLMMAGFLIAGILFNIYYQYSYEKDYLSEFTEQGEALDKLETGTDLAVLRYRR